MIRLANGDRLVWDSRMQVRTIRRQYRLLLGCRVPNYLARMVVVLLVLGDRPTYVPCPSVDPVAS